MADIISFLDAQPSPPVVMRRCTKCGEEKAEGEFYVKNRATGRLSTSCKKCDCAAVKKFSQDHPERVWSKKPENLERRRQLVKERYHADPEKHRAVALASFYKRHDAALALQRQRYQDNREAQIAKSLKWNRENPEKVMAWKEANRPRIRAAVKKHRLLHPETHLNSRAIRRQRKMSGIVERIKPGMNDRLMIWQKGKCPYCHIALTPQNRHRDHVIPVSRGGAHAEYNFQLTCKPCNLRKHAKHPLDFAAEMGVVQNPIYIPI